jgi:pyruvate-formate lyase
MDATIEQSPTAVIGRKQGERGTAAAIGSTDRVRRLNLQLHSTQQTICLHRARTYTRVFAQTEGEPMAIRRAKALESTLGALPVSISRDELIVGRHACRLRSLPVAPECHGGWLQWDLENLPGRPETPYPLKMRAAELVRQGLGMPTPVML